MLPESQAIPTLIVERHTRTWLIRRVLLVCWDAAGWALALALAAALRSISAVDGLPLAVAADPGAGRDHAPSSPIGAILQTYRGRHWWAASTTRST